MTLDASAPEWVCELKLAYESGAHGQFVLHGNVADRFPHGGRLLTLTQYLDAQLLAGFSVVFSFDAGNGLSVLRGVEKLREWPAFEKLGPLPREPRQAVEVVALAPMGGDPMLVQIGFTRFALRRAEAARVRLRPVVAHA